MVHMDDKRRITHFSKSNNIICKPSSDTSVILNDLTSSEYKPANSHAITLTLLGLYSFINL